MLGKIASAIGGDLVSGAFNAYSAKQNRRFQQMMSNTAYQRAANDLEKAGLNRILALGSPASTPGGSVASMSGLGAGIVGAMNAETGAINAETNQTATAQQGASIEAQIEKWKKEGEKIVADTEVSRQKGFQEAEKTKLMQVIYPILGRAGKQFSEVLNMFNDMAQQNGRSLQGFVWDLTKESLFSGHNPAEYVWQALKEIYQDQFVGSELDKYLRATMKQSKDAVGVWNLGSGGP